MEPFAFAHPVCFTVCFVAALAAASWVFHCFSR